MAKKGFGKLVVFAAVAGATAAGISYLKKYKSFNDELEEEFHDFECGEEDDDDLFEEEEVVSIMEEEPEVHHEEPEETAEASKEPDTEKDGEANSRASRKYIPLNVSKDELKLAAKDMVTAAGEIAGAAKSVLKDAAVILSESAHEAAVVAKDTAHIARAKLNERAEYHRNRQQEEAASADETPKLSTVSETECTSSPNAEDIPAVPTETAEASAQESEQEKARNETAAAQFIPKAPSGTASLDTDADDSVLEVIHPENAQKAVFETENAIGEELDVEELDD